MCIVHQTQNFQGMFQVLHCIFILTTRRRGPQNNQEAKNFLIFFVDCSIGDAKLVFVPRYSMVSDALIG